VVENFAPTSTTNVCILEFNFYFILSKTIFIIEHKHASLIYPSVGWPQLIYLSSLYISTPNSHNIYLALSEKVDIAFTLNLPYLYTILGLEDVSAKGFVSTFSVSV